MRVALFTTGFIENTVLDLANALAENCKVLLLVPSNMYSNSYRDFLSEKVDVETFFLPRMRDLRSLIAMKSALDKIDKFSPDVIHMQSNGHIWLIALFFRLKSIAIVNTIHDSKPHLGDQWSKAISLSNKFGKIYTNRYIVHCDQEKKNLSSFYNINEDNIDTIPLGGHSFYKKISNKKFKERKNTILFFGRIWEYKGLDTLIKAEPYISEVISDFKIIIAGRGENMEKYRKLIINRENFLILNGRIPDKDISKLFQISSIIAMPYKEATQSAIVPLAYLFSKPLVATHVGGVPEQVQDGVQGLLVPPDDEKALASAIVRLLNDEITRKNFGKNGFNYYNKSLSPNRISKMTIETYNKAIVKNK